jgi:hypothetical protein
MRTKEQIDLILDTFNFKNVQVTLAALGRTWAQGNEIPKVPTEDEIKNLAEFLLQKAANSSEKNAYYELCDLEAEKIDNKLLELRFVLERANPLKAIHNPVLKNDVARKA